MSIVLTKRFAAHILMFNCEKYILRTLENCGPFVEKIYVAYSETPWTYNPDARQSFVNQTDKNILKLSEFYHKIELIEDTWDREEDQRNVCLDKARADGVDYLIIHDADEFYSKEDYENNLLEIERNPDRDLYVTPWCSFWKSLDYVIQAKEQNTIIGTPEFAINCKSKVNFTRARTTNAESRHCLTGLCFHLSFVGSDVEIWQKISTWGHAHQFDREKWFDQKWSKWTLSTKNLHPIVPENWRKAIKFEGHLPEILNDWNCPVTMNYHRTIMDRLMQLKEDAIYVARNAKSLFCLKLGPEKCLLLRVFVKYLFKLVRLPYITFCLILRNIAGNQKLRRLTVSNEKIKLHLGCGEDHLPGYLNCEYRLTCAADIIMDCSSLKKFKDKSVTEIFSHAFFEHLYKAQQLPFLIDCCRVLQEDGNIIFLGIPDFEIIAQEYLSNAKHKDDKDGFNLYHVYRYSHGDPEIAQDYWLEQLHKSLFDKQYLKDLLLMSGFYTIVVFNYCYPGENIPLNLGFIGRKKPENINCKDVETILLRHDKYFSDIKNVRYYFM